MIQTTTDEYKMTEKQNLLIKNGMPVGIIIPCWHFKPNGKFYMDEDVIIPLDHKQYDIYEVIRKHRRIGDFVTVGLNTNGVSFMVEAEKDIVDYPPYEKIHD